MGKKKAKTRTKRKNARPIKRVACFCLGGHIATQNISFRKLAEVLEPKGYKFFGAEDGFKAFETGVVYPFGVDHLPINFAGFYSGAGRASLLKDGEVNAKALQRAEDFFKSGKFDIAIGSGGDDHGVQMHILNQQLIIRK